MLRFCPEHSETRDGPRMNQHVGLLRPPNPNYCQTQENEVSRSICATPTVSGPRPIAVQALVFSHFPCCRGPERAVRLCALLTRFWTRTQPYPWYLCLFSVLSSFAVCVRSPLRSSGSVHVTITVQVLISSTYRVPSFDVSQWISGAIHKAALPTRPDRCAVGDCREALVSTHGHLEAPRYATSLSDAPSSQCI